MDNIRKSLLSIVLTASFLLLAMLILGQSAYAEGNVAVDKGDGNYKGIPTVKLTFVGSTIDGENVAGPYVVDNIPKGSTLAGLIDNKTITWEEIENHFKTEVYSVKNIRVIPKKLKEYSTWSEVLNDYGAMLNTPLTEDTTLYAAMQKYVDKISLSVEKPLCGTEVKNYTEDGKHYQQNAPKITVSESTHMPLEAGMNPKWIEDPAHTSPYVGTMEGGKSYYAMVDFYGADFGYVLDKAKPPKVTVENANDGTVEYNAQYAPYKITFAVTADHNWDAGKVTKKATTSAAGIRTYTCMVCKATKTEPIEKLSDPTKQYGKDGTAVGPGASAAAADKAITSSMSEEGPKGTKHMPLALRSTKQGKTNINLT